jgi:transcription elongation factor GreA
MHAPPRPLLTRQEHERCQTQLAELRRIRDRDLPELLRDARTFVASDAAEEIAQIQDDATVVEARIARLELLLSEATVVEHPESGAGISPGHIVTVHYTRLGKDVVYVLGADPVGEARAVSMRSPVGQALLGRQVGDVLSFELPNGRVEQVRVLAVSTPGRAPEP